ncbi:MAG: hypothetical protein ACREJO_11180 [Phycisphaerales bacterium]
MICRLREWGIDGTGRKDIAIGNHHTIVLLVIVIACLYVRTIVHPAREPGSTTVFIQCDTGPDGLIHAVVVPASANGSAAALVEVGLYVQGLPRRQSGALNAAIGRAVADHLHDEVWISAAQSEGKWITGRYLSDLFFSPFVLLVVFGVGAAIYLHWRFRAAKKLLETLEAEADAIETS